MACLSTYQDLQKSSETVFAGLGFSTTWRYKSSVEMILKTEL